jgi:hypothetical protein
MNTFQLSSAIKGKLRNDQPDLNLKAGTEVTLNRASLNGKFVGVAGVLSRFLPVATEVELSPRDAKRLEDEAGKERSDQARTARKPLVRAVVGRYVRVY